MQMSETMRAKSALLGCAAIAAIASGAMSASMAYAQESATETVVVTGTRFNTDAAPAKASLDTTEPETIINKSYIENFQQPQADYVNILAIAPGLTGGDPNGVGLSDGGPKNTLRGFADGNFNITYDGIPFGDTNGPTHHNISYFPASTIGSAVVDRGPGNAGQLGANTYGGTIKLFSEGLTDDTHAKVVASYGSFGTTTEILNGQSGDLNAGALGTIRVLGNVQYVHSDGALQLQDLYTNNVLIKVEDEVSKNWRITLFGDAAFLKENLSDVNGATLAQATVFGKNFSLQNTDPTLPTFQPYNHTSKWTDMDYLRVDGELWSGASLENTDYTYAYWNHTFSPNNQNQTLCDIQHDTSEGNFPGGGWTTNTGTGLCQQAPNGNLIFPTGVASGVKDPNLGILGYSKENAYRAFGDILRLSQDYDFGWMSGQVRAGVWWEVQTTHRFRYYFDSISCLQKEIEPFHVGDIVANAACGVANKPFSGAYTGPGGTTTFSKAKSIMNGSITGVNQLGFAKLDEHSSWNQYQPFLEWEIHPLDMQDLTITPGVKFVHWWHGVNAPVGQGNLCGIGADDSIATPTSSGGACPNAPGTNFKQSFITRDTLPFAEVNYKIEPSWSVYFEYAKGIYVPDISQAFELSSAAGSFPLPETTTNYQLGTVYYADNFTFDTDVYYIPINNNIGNPVPCSFDPSQQCPTDTGKAWYKGVEGEGTYAFGDELGSAWGVDLTGLSVFVNGALLYAKTPCPGGLAKGVASAGNCWLANAPEFTAASGIIYIHNGWKFSLIEKIVGSQFADGNEDHFARIGAYGNTTATVGYAFQNLELDINADNLANSRNVTSISSPSGAIWQNNMAQYFWQSPRMVAGTIKWRY